MQTDMPLPLEKQLLHDWQRGLPIVERPFLAMAEQYGVEEEAVIEGLKSLQATGAIARVGGVIRPNTLGASTLAALAAPNLEIEATAQLMAAEPGINHVYLRENDWNLWFVATGPDRAAVDATLARIEQLTARRVLDLRLEQPYHIDLGFDLTDGNSSPKHAPAAGAEAEPFTPRCGDRQLVQELMIGLPLVPRPFFAIAQALGRKESDVMARIAMLHFLGVLPRLGVIVRHRALGWRSNAMVVWDVPEDDVDRAGTELAMAPGINLCYRRRRHEHDWPYNLYCMIHAKSREAALSRLEAASHSAALHSYPRQILFSLRCFKQTGALVAATRQAA